MKKTLSFIKLGISIIGCFLFLGCASTPEPEAEHKTADTASTNLVSATSNATNAVTNAVTNANCAATNSIVVAVSNTVASAATEIEEPQTKSPTSVGATTPKDNPRDWSVDFFNNSKTAKIDNTEIYLYIEPQKKRNNKAFLHFVDQTKIVDVIFGSHTQPIVTNRPFRVFIDPGHGGNDPGALSKDKKNYEKTITLDIAQRLQTYLSGAGFSTMLSRTDNSTTLSLEERTTMANGWGADAFVSIHINSATSSQPNGFETYVLANVGQLSTSMDANEMTADDWSFVNATYIGNKNDSKNLLLGYAIHRRAIRTSRITDRGLRHARFQVLRQAAMPAVLVECGYLSSQKDLKKLVTADYRERCARGIYQGICDYAYGRMQPGLAATPVPEQNIKASIPAPPAASTKPSAINNQSPSTTHSKQPENIPDKLEAAMKYKPAPQQPIWTPNYEEDNLPASPELSATREKALKDAGIIFSTKENNSSNKTNN